MVRPGDARRKRRSKTNAKAMIVFPDELRLYHHQHRLNSLASLYRGTKNATRKELKLLYAARENREATY